MSGLDSARIRTAEGQKLAAEQIVGFRESSDCPITNAFLYDIGSKLKEVCQGDLRTDDTYRLIVEIIRCIDCGLSRYTHSDYLGSLHFENFANCFLSTPSPFFHAKSIQHSGINNHSRSREQLCSQLLQGGLRSSP